MLPFGFCALTTPIGLALLQEEVEAKIFCLMPSSNTNLIGLTSPDIPVGRSGAEVVVGRSEDTTKLS